METFRNTYFVVDVDPVHHVVRLIRTKEPIASLSNIEPVFRELSAALRDIHRPTYGLLLDIRESKLRNDEEFETAIKQSVAILTEGWRKQATLVRTAVGSLQVSRQAREAGNEANVYRYEEEALRFLTAL